PQVGPVGDAVGRDLVAQAVAGEEGHLAPPDPADRHRRRGGAVGGVQVDGPAVGQQLVEPAAADDGDLGGGAVGQVPRRRRPWPRRSPTSPSRTSRTSPRSSWSPSPSSPTRSSWSPSPWSPTSPRSSWSPTTSYSTPRRRPPWAGAG